MLSKRIIIFPTSEKEDEICDYTWQTVSLLSQSNTVIVLYPYELVRIKDIFDSQKKFLYPRGNYHVLKPIQIIPFIRFPSIRLLNQKLSLAFYYFFLSLVSIIRNKSKVIIWIFHPQLAWTLDFFPFSTIVYDIIDYFTSPLPKEAFKFEIWKRKIINKAKIITSISHTLREKYQPLTKKIIHKVPQGFNSSLFDSYNKNIQNNSILDLTNKIGFVGHINERIDWKMMVGVCKALPKYNFIFVGPINHEQLVSDKKRALQINQLFSALPNLHHIEQQPKENIPAIISQFDVCMIPYNSSYPFNSYCFPMKLFEYLYLNKKVISTDIKELRRFYPLVTIAESEGKWVEAITHMLKSNDILNTRHISLANSWQNKVEKISQIVEDEE